jgi:hypothetical protein
MIFELTYTCAINIFYVNDSDFYVDPCRGGKQVKSAPNQIGLSQIGPKSNRPQVKIIEELKLSSKYSCVL